MLNELMTKVERAVSAIEKVAAALEKLATSQVPAPVKEVAAPRGKKATSAPVTPDTSKSSAASVPSTAPAAASNPPAAQPTPESLKTPPAADEMEDDDFGAPAAGGEAKVWTADDIRAAAVKLAGAKGEEVPKKIIKEVGNSPNIKSMDPSKFGAVMAAIQEAMK